MTMGSQTGFPTGDPLSSTFSALQLLRNYNQVLTPSVPGNNLVQVYHQYTCGTSYGDFSRDDHFRPGTFSFSPMLGAFQPYSTYSIPSSPPPLTEIKSRQASYLTASGVYARRTRGEKKPIPEDQKDDRYYERRKRNNQAAKKSRDARKLREDQIALRASLLEHENAILRAQVLSLREETQCLRQLVLSQKKVSGKSVKKESSPLAAAATRKWDTDYDAV